MCVCVVSAVLQSFGNPLAPVRSGFRSTNLLEVTCSFRKSSLVICFRPMGTLRPYTEVNKNIYLNFHLFLIFVFISYHFSCLFSIFIFLHLDHHMGSYFLTPPPFFFDPLACFCLTPLF